MKEQQLRDLLGNGFNVHTFVVPATKVELRDFIHKNVKSTIRFDRDHNNALLPFYTTDNLSSEEDIDGIWSQAERMGCKIICSSGMKYDRVQICNFVYQVVDGEFVLELNFDKIPLRHMYNERLITVRGHITDEFKDMQISGQTRRYISRTLIEQILGEMIKHRQDKLRVECTLYPIGVGELNHKIVYWQKD